MKNDCLNVCKGIAAFAVVFIHCNFPSPVGGMMNGLARFGVPLFFMVSGYFSYGKGTDTVKRRMRKLFALFLGANGVYFVWRLLALREQGSLTLEAAAGFFNWKSLLGWVLWNESPFMGHLWFLGALLYCYCLYGIFVRKGLEERVYFLIPLCLGANLLLGEGLSVFGKGISFLYVRNFWLTGLPFFLWGHWMFREERKGKLMGNPGLCAAGIVFGACLSMGELMLSGGGELYLGSILMTAGIFSLALRRPDFGKGSFLAHVGEKTALHIYLWQMIVFDIVEKLAYIGGIHEHMVYQWMMPLTVGGISWLLAEAVVLGVRFKRVH